MSTPQIDTAAPARRPIAIGTRPGREIRVVIIDAGRSVESVREVAALVKAGVVEDARPAAAKTAACAHDKCGAKFLAEVGWVSRADLTKAGNDPSKAPLRCFGHRRPEDCKVPVAVAILKREAKEADEARLAKAAAAKREAQATEKRGAEDLENLLRRTRR